MNHQRKPHVVSDNPIVKAQKIESIIKLNRFFFKNDSILEIGTGSGGIASYFAHKRDMQFHITVIDVVDSRALKRCYQFQLVDGTKIPFNNETIDVILTNHVIEHVGEYESQLEHLNEIKRLLKNGIAYLAVLNKWMLIEFITS
jgi:ubiquinone/menaquinone biosynthesis C-methylase UbiE